MKKKENWKRVISKITLFVSAVFLLAVSFYSCQKDEMILGSENIELKSSAISEIYLDFPDVVAVGEDFDITFSATCGRIMIERGFLAKLDEYGEIINKVYTGLDCATENLMWESVGEDVFENCEGATITENLEEPGTYVYRAKLNFKAERNTECPDCGTFVGNQFECFMITVVAGNENEGTFTDARDGKVYKWVKIGDQIWMAENLAYETATGSSPCNGDESNVATYGRLYTWNAAQTAAPEGWHLPSNAEWNELIQYLTDNGYGYEGSGDDIAKAIASTTGWSTYPSPGTIGNDPGSNNSSGFNALPSGVNQWGSYPHFGSATFWWSSDQTSTAGYNYNIWYYSSMLYQEAFAKNFGFSVRCVKDTE